MIFAYSKSKRFRGWLKQASSQLRLAAKWLVRKWRFIVFFSFLIFLEVTILYVYADWKIVALSLAHLVIAGFGCRLLAKQHHALKNKKSESQSRFIPVPIPPGVGNKYFGKFYIDSPSGDVLLGGVEFQLQPKSLVFDTSGQIRQYSPRDDGCKEVRFVLSEPAKSIKSVHFLINSSNSKSFYRSEKVGEIKLIFKDAPPITTELILGKNLREWCIGATGNLVRELSEPLSKVVWQGANKDGTNAVIDSLEVQIYKAMRNNTLEQIAFVHTPLQRHDDTLGVQYFVSAITLEIDTDHK